MFTKYKILTISFQKSTINSLHKNGSIDLAVSAFLWDFRNRRLTEHRSCDVCPLRQKSAIFLIIKLPLLTYVICTFKWTLNGLACPRVACWGTYLQHYVNSQKFKASFEKRLKKGRTGFHFSSLPCLNYFNTWCFCSLGLE